MSFPLVVTLWTLKIKVGFYFLVKENVDLLIKNGTKKRKRKKKDEVLSWALMHYHDSSCGHGGLRPHVSILRNIITQKIIIIITYKHHLQFNKSHFPCYVNHVIKF